MRSCPVFWEHANPAGRGVDAVREVRDDIDHRVGVLLAEPVPRE